MTLAHMALAVRLGPDDIRPFGSAAADMLADLIAERNAEAQQDALDAARMVDALSGRRQISPAARKILEADIAESLRRINGE
jgi:hypothetical protein